MRIHSLYRVKANSLSAAHAVLVEVRQGNVGALDFSIPGTPADRPIVHAPAKKSVVAVSSAEGRTVWRLTFDRALEGAVQVDLEHRTPLQRKSPQTVSVPDVRVLGAEVAEGSVGVAAGDLVEVTKGATYGLHLRSADDLPRVLRLRSSEPIVLGFVYSHIPWRLEVHITTR